MRNNLDIDKALGRIEKDFRKSLVSPEESSITNKRLEHEKQRRIRNMSKLPLLNFNYELCNKTLLSFVEVNRNKSLFLLSKSSGKCKTRTMIYIADEFYAKQGLTVNFYSAGELARVIANAYDNFGSNHVIGEIKKTFLLIIDDLGKEKLTERAAADIFEILDYRYLNNKLTWIASNYSGHELEIRFGDKGSYLVRRIKENYTIHTV